MRQRDVWEDMFDAVERGHAFTIKQAGKPIAMVLPWPDWQRMNQALRVVLADDTSGREK